ncbi:lysozyme inhibitor LprI family protein [Pseudomonas marginalis]|uniref:lysozyme inhibitor LprI family protein n=1 Tax=Pseudomonas marginalis TaxID=298 RepID=UPI0009BB3F69|nr:lysozyme inhibitor LprI family protein [Pseudomonas marginalis]
MLSHTRLVALLLLPGLFAFPVFSHGASFDCAAARTSSEVMICKHADLSALDSQLQAAYQGARAAATPASQATLLNEQRHWVRYVRDVCLDKACVERVYNARIELLQQDEKYIADRAECSIPEGKSCRGVVFFSRPSGTAWWFQALAGATASGGKNIGV